LQTLLEMFYAVPSVRRILQEFKKEDTPFTVTGVGEAQKVLLFLLTKPQDKVSLYIAPDFVRARQVHDRLAGYMGRENCLFFPSIDYLSLTAEAMNRDDLWKRMEVIRAIAAEKPVTIVAPVDSLMTKLLPGELFFKEFLHFKQGERMDFDSLPGRLVALGYRREEMVDTQGSFCVRGGIVDVWIPAEKRPLRIEFFDDEVDTIRIFEPENQRSIENLIEATVTPAMEFCASEADLKKLRQTLKAEAEQLTREDMGRAAAFMEKYSLFINAGGDTMDAFPFMPYYTEDAMDLLDYCGDPFIFLDEPDRIEEEYQGAFGTFAHTFEYLMERGEALPKQFDRVFFWHELKASIENRGHRLSALLFQEDGLPEMPRTMAFQAREVMPFKGKLTLFEQALRRYHAGGYGVLLAVRDEDRAERMKKALELWDIPYSDMPKMHRPPALGEVMLSHLTLTESFEFQKDKLVYLSTERLFESVQRITKTKKKDLFDYKDLKPGDYVVHTHHGIGRYHGIMQLNVGGVFKDYLYVEYAKEDKLYIPVDQVGLIQKYVSEEGYEPRLHRLGGGDWKKAQARVKDSLKELAIDLLKLYAVRKTTPGFAFSKDGDLQLSFDLAFPHQETPDQLRAIEEIKADMEKTQAMDRLLCGDVGFGKTEVALRAVFKCVADGKQAAILVPTTVLAQQHYMNILERFKDFPVNVGLLSRFRSASEVKETLEKLKTGRLDIIVGTHKLLSKDVQFKDLGLLVIDEEQRFGVGHKETIKDIKKNVDVLTLSATPIPRTLDMALSGLKDMSIIESAPENRYPIHTYVMEYDKNLIRDAVLREVRRDGQVYIVHNRIQDLDALKAELMELIPEVRIEIAHGQVQDVKLERVIMDFLEHKFDVLLTTTIIETGVDIPNVNTLIVLDADHFGLSQLHQLRGRVGRTNRQAYAYLTYRRNKTLSEVAEKRLKAIRDFTEFGSGVKIAMRDLEIRGSGNLLGPEQHGHIVSVGYDMYYKLLQETMDELSGKTVVHKEPVVVDINADKYISKAYIPLEDDRIDIYKRLQAMEDESEMDDLMDELIDRFGDLPPSVENLFAFVNLRLLCEKSGIGEVNQQKDVLQFVFREDFVLPDGVLRDLDQKFWAESLSLGKKDGKLTLLLKTGNEPPIRKARVFLEGLQEIIASKENKE